MRIMLVVAIAALAYPPSGFTAEGNAVPLADRMAVAGEWSYHEERIAVKGVLYDAWGETGSCDFAVFEVKGYSYFTALVGVREGNWGESRLTVELDGEEVAKEMVRDAEPAKAIRVRVAGKRSLTLRKQPNTPGIWVEPRLLKGEPTTTGSGGGKTGLDPVQPAVPATFAVDPNDLQKLAEGLRKSVDEDPDLKARLAAGKIAVASFSLVDIPSPSVAQNVAEDLATALIKKKFRLVERGQLDAVMKELKLQNTGLIDPKSAQEIGKQTGCTLILVGSISDRGGFVVVNARLLETQTGDAVAAESVEMRKIPINR